MRLRLRKPAQSLNKAYASQSIPQEYLTVFRRALGKLMDRVDENESETDQKNRVATFLNAAFCQPAKTSELPAESPWQLSDYDRISLLIRYNPARPDLVEGLENALPGNDLPGNALPGKALPGLAIAVKKVFAGDMITTLKNNVRALHELILFYFETSQPDSDPVVSQLIITDVYNWFFVDETEFRRFFYDNPKLQKLYQTKLRLQKDAGYFYAEAARILRGIDEELTVTYLNLRDAADALALDSAEGNRVLIPVYKLFSPEHLFNLPFANDGNTLDRRFFAELLHIIGLRETTGSKRTHSAGTALRRLPDNERQPGSLLENTIESLRINQSLTKPDRPEQYGGTTEEQLAAVGLELCLTWLGRVLFLKLLESQLMSYHQFIDGSPDRPSPFLTVPYIRTFADLNDLFFAVMAVPETSRPVSIKIRFDQARPIPYLNSSLFDPTDLERATLTVDQLQDRIELPLFARSVITSQYYDPPADSLPTLHYLFAFLDGYAFSTDGPAGILPDNKPFMSATGLGLVLETLSGHPGRPSFTPGFLSTRLVRDAVRQAVLTRFNERFGWTCTTIATLRDRLDTIDCDQANALVDGLRLVDPAVGSGHLLVSALNELIALKAELGILTDPDGQPLRPYDIRTENDRLTVTNADGVLFQYVAPRPDLDGRPTEIQRVQETLFHAKLTLIENCLFGVDRNLNAVAICQLRLWIELLKSVYYVVDDEKQVKKSVKKGRVLADLHPLPNLNLNVKAGNSLISRVALQAGFAYDTDGLRTRLTTYQALMPRYFHETNPVAKNQLLVELSTIQGYLSRQFVAGDRALTDKLQRLTADFSLRYQTNQLFGNALTAKQLNHRDKLRAGIDRLMAEIEPTRHNPIFGDALEWRLVFPQLLDEEGSFNGFDVVVSQPPVLKPSVLAPVNRHLQRAYPNVYVRSAEGYVYFVELGLNLLRSGGQLACLLPAVWLKATYSVPLRAYLKSLRIRQITDVGKLPDVPDSEQESLLTVQKADATGQFGSARLLLVPYDRPAGETFNDEINQVSTDSLDDSGWPIF